MASQLFTSTTNDWQPPEGVSSITVWAWGGGAAGQDNGGDGGGGGAWAGATLAWNGTDSYDITIGAGGTAEGNGGDTSLSDGMTTLVLAKGAVGNTGGSSGSSIGDDTNAGGAGGLGISGNGGGGGGAGGTDGAGTAGARGDEGGAGGGGAAGNPGGSGGDGGNGGTSGSPGIGGGPYGGGGGGAGSGNATSAAGGNGAVQIFWTDPPEEITGSGGLELGGEGTVETELHAEGGGGLSLGGSGEHHAEIHRSGSGGLTLGGAGTVLHGELTENTGSGGLTLGGEGVVSHTDITFEIEGGSGGLTLGGAGTVSKIQGAGHVPDTAPFLGGFAITSAKWISSHALKVSFSSSYGSSYQYQLYLGRTLVGWTRATTDRVIVGQGKPYLWPEHVTLLAVSPANVRTDYGYKLPSRPYNRAHVRFLAGDSPDAKTYEVSAGTTPGGAVDITNIVGRARHDTGRWYSIFTQPLEGCGTWNLELAARDNTPPTGNRGEAAELTAAITTYPPDVARDRDGNRFDVDVADGVLTATW